VEQVFGWFKQPSGLRKVRHVGRWKIQQVAYLWAAAYNLLRMTNLGTATCRDMAPSCRRLAQSGTERQRRRRFPRLMNSDHA